MGDNFWHTDKKNVHTTADHISVKLRTKAGTLISSCCVPSAIYPLSGAPEVFSASNTQLLAEEGPETVKAVSAAFNATQYVRGFCYQNTKNLISGLKRRGIDAISYVGWVFIGNNDTPVHHCWCVLRGKTQKPIVLDLADDYTLLMQIKEKTAEPTQKPMEFFAEFVKSAARKPNTERCAPVGIPSSEYLYIGSPCNPDRGRVMYQNLLRKYPDHECERNCDPSGMNATQRYLKEKGL